MVYAVLYFLQVGWPAWAATAAGAIFFLFARRLPGPADATAIYYIGVGTFLACVAVLSVGRRIERTLELLNWVLVAVHPRRLPRARRCSFVPARDVARGGGRARGFDLANGTFDFFPPGADFFLLGALVAYSGAGGVANIELSNWARDKGYGMGERGGYIPGAVGGRR